jgi:hypothetical protein
MGIQHPPLPEKNNNQQMMVLIGCSEKWRGKQGRCAERGKTAVGVQQSLSSHQQKLVGSLDNNDDKKYTTNKQQMMAVDNGWDGRGHVRK